jgi:F0F1-type ATP synthase assembly protein I
MAFNNPPPQKPGTRRDDGGMGTLLRAEKLTQIAFVLPVAVFVGWALGAALDKWLHQHWIYLAGIIFGSVAGFIQIFRLVAASSAEIATKDDKK